LGDDTQPAWENAPDWQRKSAIDGVEFHRNNPGTTPEKSHQRWLEEKYKAGWTYGETKDVDNKKHPCFVPYDELPKEQRAKDYLFTAVVQALTKEESDDVSVDNTISAT
jgi:hypothetical protein